MAYKSLLTVVTRADLSDAAIRGAAALAAAQDAHLDILALGVDHTQVGYSYIGTGAVFLPLSAEQAEHDAKATEAAIRKALAAQDPALRWSLETAVTQIGALSELVAQRARFADLVLQPRPYGPGPATAPATAPAATAAPLPGPEAEAVIEAALFGGRAPVLVLPGPGGDRAATPRRAVIAWNQSVQAMTAIRLSLPLLKQADLVNIAIIDPPRHGPERSDPGGLLCQMLVRHGVRAEVSVLARTLPRISDVLDRHLRDQGADLLVMGAYGHSRFREAILGGATRDMLEQAQVAVLMAH